MNRFTLVEHLGRDWPETYLTYRCQWAPGELYDPNRLWLWGDEIEDMRPAQLLSGYVKHTDGSIAAGDVAFRCGLLANETKTVDVVVEAAQANFNPRTIPFSGDPVFKFNGERPLRVVSLRSDVSEHGPLFIEWFDVATFSDGGTFVRRLRYYADELDRVYISHECHAGPATAETGHAFIQYFFGDANWRPDTVHYFASKGAFGPGNVGSRSGAIPSAVIGVLSAGDVGGVFQFAALTDSTRPGSMVAIIPMHAGSWRNAHTGPSGPVCELRTTNGNAVELRIRITPADLPDPMAHTGEDT